MMKIWKSCEVLGAFLQLNIVSVKCFDEVAPDKIKRTESNVEVLSVEQIPPYWKAFMLVLVGVTAIRQEIGKYQTTRCSKNEKDFLYFT